MSLFDALLLGILQGITEFLPISSSGHLVVAESFLHLPVADLAGFDVAVHFGTLLAIFVYFWKDIVGLLRGLVSFVGVGKAGELREERRMIGYLAVGMIPAVVVGLLFRDFLQETFRNPKTVAVTLAVVAVYFVFAEMMAKKAAAHRQGGVSNKAGSSTKKREIGLLQAAFIGLAQAVALIPGISRSGATISTGLLQGVEREKAARFSFLLGAVAISAAALLALHDVWQGELFLPGLDVLAVGIVSSFLAGLLSVRFLMKFLKHHTLLVFAGYRLVLAAILLLVF